MEQLGQERPSTRELSRDEVVGSEVCIHHLQSLRPEEGRIRGLPWSSKSWFLISKRIFMNDLAQWRRSIITVIGVMVRCLRVNETLFA